MSIQEHLSVGLDCSLLYCIEGMAMQIYLVIRLFYFPSVISQNLQLQNSDQQIILLDSMKQMTQKILKQLEFSDHSAASNVYWFQNVL